MFYLNIKLCKNLTQKLLYRSLFTSKDFLLFRVRIFLKVPTFCFLHCPVCSKHSLLLTSAIRPGDNLHNYVQKIEALNRYQNFHFLYEIQVLFIMWHSSKGSLGRAMHSLLILNLLSWDLPYFLLSWEKI